MGIKSADKCTRETAQQAKHRLEPVGCLIAVILGGVGAALFCSYANLSSETLGTRIGMFVFLWGMLAFLVYEVKVEIITVPSRLIRFLRQRYTWQVIGWLLILTMPPWLVFVWRTGLPLAVLLKFVLPTYVVMALFGAGGFPVRLTIKRAVVVMVIGALGMVGLFVTGVWISAAWYGMTFADMFALSTTWDALLGSAVGYSMICYFVWMAWSGCVSLWQSIKRLPASLGEQWASLVKVYQMLVNEIRLRPITVWTAVLIILYLMLLSIVSTDFLFDLALELFGAWIPGSAQEWQQILAFPLLGLGLIVLMPLMRVTVMYMMIPQELERVRLGNAIARAVFVLMVLFGMWWFFFTTAAENLTLVRPGAFVFTDGRSGRPRFDDYAFYVFAVMTNANYGELKPVGSTAHYMVMAMTATGLALFAIFVGVALSLRGHDRRGPSL